MHKTTFEKASKVLKYSIKYKFYCGCRLTRGHVKTTCSACWEVCCEEHSSQSSLVEICGRQRLSQRIQSSRNTAINCHRFDRWTLRK